MKPEVLLDQCLLVYLVKWSILSVNIVGTFTLAVLYCLFYLRYLL